MFISHIDSIEKIKLPDGVLKGVTKQSPVGGKEGWNSHVMRVFTVEPGGHTPRHSHPWPHINYVLSGKGELFHQGETSTITGGSVAYVPDNTEHQFINNGTEELRFICIVPTEGDK